MKKAIILAILTIQFGVIFAQKREFIEEYTYIAGDRDSKDICYDIAKTHLKAQLLDKMGVYVRNETTLNNSDTNGKIDQKFDEKITTLSSAITEFHVIEEKWDGTRYWMKAKVTLDTTYLRQMIVNLNKATQLDVMRAELDAIKAELAGARTNTTIRNEQYSQKLFTSQLIRAGHDEQFISLTYSKENHLLFVGTTKGRMIVFNENDSIIKTFKFQHLGKISLDNVGSIGAYVDENNIIYFFNQKTLKVTDTVKVANEKSHGTMKVWFTRTGIFISSNKNVYRYTISHSVVDVAPSYTVLDYDFKSDQFLLGLWDVKLSSDRKVKDIYIADATNIGDKKHILTIDRSFEQYTYLMDNAATVVSYDGKGNYYKFNTYSWERKNLIQDTIKNSSRKTFGLSKINDNTYLTVRYNAIPLTPENIKKYELTLEDNPTELIFKRSKNDEIVRSVMLLQSIYANQIVINEVTKTIYYLSSGDNGNKLISIH